MKIIVISCSLHPRSRSYVLARALVDDLQSLGVAAPLYDLRDYDLTFADATTAHKTAHAQEIISAIRAADTVLMTLPIYNYDVNSAAKNLLEIGLQAWNNKLVGFLCAAGGRSSYMAVMGLANHLMLDFRCLIIPRFVYATGANFGDDRLETMYIVNDDVKARIRELAQTATNLTRAVKASGAY